MTRWGRILTRTLLAVTAVSAPLVGAAPAFAANNLQAKVDPAQGPVGTQFTVTVKEHVDGKAKCGGKVQLRNAALLPGGKGQAISAAVDMPQGCETSITATTPVLWGATPGAKSFFAVLTSGITEVVSNRLTFVLGVPGGPRTSAPAPTDTPTKTAAPSKTPKATLTTEGAPTAQDSVPDFGALTNGATPVDSGTGAGVALTKTGSGSSMLGLGIAGAVLIILGFAAVLFLLLRKRDDAPPTDGQPAYQGGGGPHDPTYGGGYDRDYVGGGGAYASAGAPYGNAQTMVGGGYPAAGGPYGAGPTTGGFTGGGAGYGGAGNGAGYGGPAGGATFGGQAGGVPLGGQGGGASFGGQAGGASFGGSAGGAPLGGQGGEGNWPASGPGGNWQAQPAGAPDGTVIGPPLSAAADPWAQHDATDIVPRLPNRPEPPTGR